MYRNRGAGFCWASLRGGVVAAVGLARRVDFDEVGGVGHSAERCLERGPHVPEACTRVHAQYKIGITPPALYCA